MSGGSQPSDLRAIAADPDAFEAFYRQHVEAVQRFVARRVGDREHAADLTAEVFVAAIESAAAFRPTRNGSAVAWLYGVARNVVANDRRRAGRERAATARVVGRRLVGDDDVARMDERLDAAAGARELYRAMDVLSDGERAVLELVALDELPIAEAAAALDIGPVAARVRLHRARRRLERQLALATDDDEVAESRPAEVTP
jgi:RNA polymerase sigma-70 factor (ECF subfamily)